MKKNKLLIGLILAVFCVSISFFGCDDDKEEVHMWIAAEREMCGGPLGNEYLSIMYKWKESDNHWMCMGFSIKEFEYEEGYEYHLLVESTPIKNPGADQSSESYELRKVISKTKKEE